MLVVTTKDLNPGTTQLPVQTEVCPNHGNWSSSCPGQQPLVKLEAFCAQGGRL